MGNFSKKVSQLGFKTWASNKCLENDLDWPNFWWKYGKGKPKSKPKGKPKNKVNHSLFTFAA